MARKGKVVHLSARGVMDLESKQPMTPAAMFRIASMTKPVVGVAVMMMIEEGKLHLNDPVSRYIPEFRGMKVGVAQPANPQPGGGQAGGGRGAELQFYTVPAQREITIKDLLTHVSGLGSGPMGNSGIEKVARKDGEKLSDYIPAWEARRSSSSPDRAGRIAQAPASKRSAASSKSLPGCRSTSSFAAASSIRWG